MLLKYIMKTCASLIVINLQKHLTCAVHKVFSKIFNIVCHKYLVFEYFLKVSNFVK